MQTVIQKTLIREFETCRSKNSAYSARAFARKLGMSSGALSAVMRGRRRISKKLALRLAKGLGLHSTEFQRFMEPFFDRASSRTRAEISYHQLEMEQYYLVAQWFHFAILSLVKLDDFQNDSVWIAKRLGISVSQARDAVDRLTQLGLLIQSKRTLVRTQKNITTPDGVKNEALQTAHRNNLLLASKVLDSVSVELRDFSSITFPVGLDKIVELKKRVRDFQDDILEWLENSHPKEEVYRICFQVFPLTKGERSNERN